LVKEKPIRKWKLVKDKTRSVIDLANEIMQVHGIRVLGIKRNGDEFELTFDRDLTVEELSKINAIKNLTRERLPEYQIKEIEDS